MIASPHDFTLKKDGKSQTFLLSGDLTLDHMVKARDAFAPLLASEKPKSAKGRAGKEKVSKDKDSEKGALRCDLSGLMALDTAGALLLKNLQDKAAETGQHLVFSGLKAEYKKLFEMVASLDLEVQNEASRKPAAIVQLLERIGKGSIRIGHSSVEILTFFGQSTVALARVFRHPKHFRFSTLSRHIEETGINAVPIVALIAFLISIVLAYQGASQLKPLGAERFTVNLVGISVLREMGVLLTAIMVAGRSGSAFTAEIGVMKVTQEVDALNVVGIDPFELLVVPRMLALMITLPLLTFISDIVGLFGGAVICVSQLDIPLLQYIDQLHHVAHGHDLFVGLIKAPVFAFIIAVVGCKHGMDVSGSAESVGTLTTVSVVRSIFLVLAADAFFSILFAKMGI